MASLTVALPLAMAAIISLAVFALMVPVAGQFSGLPQAPQPPCRAPSTQSAALQDAVEGIAGLMQRFEDLQPQIAQLPAPELQQIAQPAQKLHERFENMQKKLVAINGNAGPELEEEAITFHRDLAVFVNGVARRFGITGPRSLPGAASVAAVDASQRPGSFGARRSPGGLAGGAGAASPATEQRLQAAMQAIQSGMQRFESLHQKLATLPAQVLNPLADQAQRLHEEFLRLQQKGMQLASGQLMLEADAAPYADELESYMSRQLTFVGDAEYQVKQAAAPSSSGYQGMLGNRLSPAPVGAQAASFGPLPATGAPAQAMGSMGSTGSIGIGPMGQAPLPGQVTPETDRRLSAIIEKVIRLIQEFQGLAPQLSRIPQQVLAPLANMGTSLDTRFRELQRRGSEIAGDNTRPMTEKDASQYLKDMEAFHSEQERYVEQAKQALQAAPAQGLGAGGLSLGSARLEDLRGAGASANTFGGLPNAPSIGLGGLGGLGGPKANGGGFGAGLGGFGGQRAPGNTLHAPTISVNNFGAASFGGFGRKGAERSSEAPGLPGLPNLEEMGRATLNTAVLPSQRGVCSAGVCGESSL